MTLKNWMPSQIKNIKFVKFSSLFLPLNFARFLNLFFVFLCIKLNIFRTSSPHTSCYRLGPCLSTATRSWWSWLLPALKNRPSVTITWTKTKFKLKHLSPTNKDKIYLRQDLKLATNLLLKQLAERRYWTRSWWPKIDALTSGSGRSSGWLCGDTRSRKTCNPFIS